MPNSMRVRIITRDISMFPHRDLEHVPLHTDLEVWWGTKDVPTRYVTVMELGEQRLDFGGGLDLTPRSADSYDKSLDSIESSPVSRRVPRKNSRREARRKTTRKKAKAKPASGRSRGRGASKA